MMTVTTSILDKRRSRQAVNDRGIPGRSIDAPYPPKPYADFTADDRRAMRRFEQGASHARQGRADLLGACAHYDAGHSSVSDGGA